MMLSKKVSEEILCRKCQHCVYIEATPDGSVRVKCEIYGYVGAVINCRSFEMKPVGEGK